MEVAASSQYAMCYSFFVLIFLQCAQQTKFIIVCLPAMRNLLTCTIYWHLFLSTTTSIRKQKPYTKHLLVSEAHVSNGVMGNNISHAQMEDYKETVKGKFDEKEIRHMHKLFMRAAPSGEMGRLEFKNYIESLDIFKFKEHHETYEQIFRGYDRDKNGSITFKEYLLYHLGIVYSTEELFDILFAMYDVDENGYISKDEMNQVITNATRWMGDCDVESREVQETIADEVRRILAFCDLDRDGKISKDELRVVSQKHPEILEKLKNLA